MTSFKSNAWGHLCCGCQHLVSGHGLDAGGDVKNGPILALWAAHTLDHVTGWYDPVERRLTWHDFPRCLP